VCELCIPMGSCACKCVERRWFGSCTSRVDPLKDVFEASTCVCKFLLHMFWCTMCSPLSWDTKDAFIDPYIIRELSRCIRVLVCYRVYIEFGYVVSGPIDLRIWPFVDFFTQGHLLFVYIKYFVWVLNFIQVYAPFRLHHLGIRA